MTNICLLHHYSFLLGRSKVMATDIGFLEPGLDVYALRLGIGHKELRKIWGNAIFLCALTFLCRVSSLAIALLNITPCLPTPLCPLPLILLVLLVRSLLHSLDHYTTLVSPWQSSVYSLCGLLAPTLRHTA
jgi:hypothetical protein